MYATLLYEFQYPNKERHQRMRERGAPRRHTNTWWLLFFAAAAACRARDWRVPAAVVGVCFLLEPFCPVTVLGIPETNGYVHRVMATRIKMSAMQ